MAEIVLENVTKTFPDGTKAVDGLSLTIPDGKVMALVGPSGCGKTTALRMIAGLEDMTDGTIRIGDEVVNELDAGERDIAMVFQNYALYPHMTVYQNMALSLRIRKLDKREMKRRVAEAARVLRLEELLHKRPRELSGGQRQRVAMGRAIVRKPRAFLMDEPLSNLDAKLRVQMRAEILRIQHDLKVTTVYVTHDQTEAMTLGDYAAVMKLGVLQQVDSPQVLYRNPRNLFVAGFMGSPGMNMVEATLRSVDGRLFVEFGGNRLKVGGAAGSPNSPVGGYVDREVILGIRPEHLEDASLSERRDPDDRIKAVVQLREEMGSETYLHFGLDAAPVVTEDTKELAAEQGSDAVQDLHRQAAERRTTWVARVSPEVAAKEGEHVELSVDTRRLYFFDRHSSEAIVVGERQHALATD